MINKTPMTCTTSRRGSAAAAAVATAILITACGSGGSSTITVGNENSADNALIHSGKSPVVSESKEASVKTPKSGPLSKEPSAPAAVSSPPKKLEIKNLIVGGGTEAKTGDPVTVNYVGVLGKTGKVFESSFKREPFKFTLGKGEVIKGWDKGIVGMKVGGRRELVIPAELAYGKAGSAKIPGNETLIFVVDLLSA